MSPPDDHGASRIGLTKTSHCPWINNCVGINNHRHFFLYLINLTLGILFFDWLLYYYFTSVSGSGAKECLMLSESLCKVVNTDPYMVLLGIWVSLQLTWVGMLLFVQFVQVARAMTTYENMYGINDGSSANLTHNFTSTGAPLDPGHPDALRAPPSAAADPLSNRPGGHAGHRHGRGFLQQWSRILGIDTFIETATGRGAATAQKQRKKKNPYSRGYVQNCKDFWCDPAPMFGRRENGDAVLNGQRVNWTETYESPTAMDVGGRRGRGGYETVADDEV